LDTGTSSSEVLIDGEALKSTTNGLQIAVNEIHVQGSHLYFTSFKRATFGRYPISLPTGLLIGAAEIIAESFQGDDFAVSADEKFARIAKWSKPSC
jgi:hypothetical protein